MVCQKVRCASYDTMSFYCIRYDLTQFKFDQFAGSYRLGSLEGAILKGLKAISDRVSAALSEKLDLTAFNEFKVQVRGFSKSFCVYLIV